MLYGGIVQAGDQFVKEAATVPLNLEGDGRLIPDYAQEVFFHPSLDGGIIEKRPQEGEEETPLSSATLIYDNNRRRNITIE